MTGPIRYPIRLGKCSNAHLEPSPISAYRTPGLDADTRRGLPYKA